MKIRSHISLYLAPFVLAAICVFFVVHFYFVRKTLVESAQNELIKIEQNMHRAAQALLSTAINSYLRGITEQNLDYIRAEYVRVRNGDITLEQAKEKIQRYFNLQQVGDSGYMVAVEEKGGRLYLDLHPFLPKTDCTETEGCSEWAKTRNGYTEYDWKNPSDNTFRKKAAYVEEFPEWNWIVGASSYRDEFVKLVDVEDLSRLISPIRINKTGYFFVFDENLHMLIHPEIQGGEGADLINSRGENVLQMLRDSEENYVTYMWKNPSEKKERQKYAFIEKLEGYNWYLVASGYVSEVYEPISYLKNLTVVMVLVTGGVLLMLIFHLSKNISTPLWHIRNAIHDFYQRKEKFVWKKHAIEEINTLGNVFAEMTEELDTRLTELREKNRQLASSQRMNEESRLYLEAIINSMPSIIIGVDPAIRVTRWNVAAQQATGLLAGDVYGRSLFEVYEGLAPHREALVESLAAHKTLSFPHTFDEDGEKVHHVEITIYPLVTPGYEGAVIRIDETTERVEMEQRLRQSQKMDAVGQLSGGIAHDFNNMLSGIMGSAELLRARVSPEEQKLVRIILEASGRAGELIQKLLAFSRKESIAFAPIDLHTVVEDSIEILRRTLKKRIVVEAHLTAENSTVNGDWSQLQSSLLNIGINAGHAMPDGGTLTFSTTSISFEEKHLDDHSQEIAAGDYIQLEIRDTGVGIPRENLRHIFEPFFTTRKQNEGTGLGLAAVYGAIRQHNGAVTVYSEVGRGTCFTLYLPVSERAEKVEPRNETVVTGRGCVLIIDDEPIVRATAKMMLEKLGYSTLDAQNGRDGVNIYQKHGDGIDVILLDMIMPVMDGAECFYALREINPAVKVIISSGFTRDADLAGLKRDGLNDFVRKPYNLMELSRIIARVMLES